MLWNTCGRRKSSGGIGSSSSPPLELKQPPTRPYGPNMGTLSIPCDVGRVRNHPHLFFDLHSMGEGQDCIPNTQGETSNWPSKSQTSKAVKKPGEKLVHILFYILLYYKKGRRLSFHFSLSLSPYWEVQLINQHFLNANSSIQYIP